MGDLLPDAGQVAMRKVRSFVGENADHLVRRFGGHDRTGVDEHPGCVGDEGVEAVVLDEEDLELSSANAGSLEDRRRVVLDQRLGLRVANDVDAVGEDRLRWQGEGRGNRRRQ